MWFTRTYVLIGIARATYCWLVCRPAQTGSSIIKAPALMMTRVLTYRSAIDPHDYTDNRLKCVSGGWHGIFIVKHDVRISSLTGRATGHDNQLCFNPLYNNPEFPDSIGIIPDFEVLVKPAGVSPLTGEALRASAGHD
jgi:hypothetical protein